MGVKVDAGTMVSSLGDLGAVDLIGDEDIKKIKVHFEAFSRVRDALNKSTTLKTTAKVVLERVLTILEARREKLGVPTTTQELEELVGPQCSVTFKIRPREVLDQLEDNGFLEVDDKTDEVKVGLSCSCVFFLLLLLLQLIPDSIMERKSWHSVSLPSTRGLDGAPPCW